MTELRPAKMRGLYAITPQNLPTQEMLAKARAALAGGATALQYRNKSDDSAKRMREAQALQQLCLDYGAYFVVNDDAALAHAVQADAVHIGRDDALPEGADLAFGASCYNNLLLAEMAARRGACYVAFGSVFASQTKPLAALASLSLLEQARSLRLPRVAIGGITLVTAPAVIAAGADAVAVISDLFLADDVAEQAHRYRQLFAELSHDSERHSI